MTGIGRVRLVMTLWAGLLVSGVGDARAQGCAWSANFGVALPLEKLPPGGEAGSLGVGPGGGVGWACEADATGAGYGVSLMVRGFEPMAAAYLLGDVGVAWSLAQHTRSPRLTLTGRAGIVGVGDILGTEPLVLTLGRNVKLPSLGMALGARARFGIPSGSGVLFMEAGVLSTFLDTEFFGETGPPRDDGFTSFTIVPISIGYRFSP